MRRILLVLESRASYGYSKNLYKLFKGDKKFTLKTFVTGTHLSNELGLSIKNIEKDQIKINYREKFYNKNLAIGIGKLTIKFSKILKIFKPNIVLIFGDRVELMSIAICCTYNPNIILAHVQAGDRSGHIDDITRMTLAKMCHVHFPATKKAYQRLIKLGEQKNRIFLVGAPQLDDIDSNEYLKKKELYINSKKINLKEKYLVILQHSVFKDYKKYSQIFSNTLSACKKINIKKYIIYPNYDPGYNFIISLIKKIKNKNFIIFKNINRQDFLALVCNSQALVGNSSTGILESASLKIGVVNIGDRQKNREQNKNIFNANYKSSDIYNKINKAIKFKSNNSKIKNVHGDGKSSEKIFKILKNIKITENLLSKDTTY
jgi:GDP/UDP-N,N'-diacetylbacillosamine 2-epimerase (hydrolysing)